MNAYRVGLVVPSSNTTIEAELPQLLARRERVAPERFTTHSSRVRMTRVTREELAAMNASADRSAAELGDARCDVLAYACLVAVMAQGPGAHDEAEDRLARAGGGAPVVTSAGALVAALRSLYAERVAMIAPYPTELTDRVIEYLAAYGISVVDSISLGITDNVEVGRLDPLRLITLADRLDVRYADAVVLSACAQMPSLAAVSTVEWKLGLPVVTAATATVHQILRRLGLPPRIPDAGRLLAC